MLLFSILFLNVATNLTELQVPSLSTFTGCSKYLFTSIVTIFTTFGSQNRIVNKGVGCTWLKMISAEVLDKKKVAMW